MKSIFRAAVLVLLGGFFAAAFGMLDAPRASNVHSSVQSVDRAGKGDRLQSAVAAPPPAADSPALSVVRKRPPLGCDPLFSPIANPSSGHLYNRCSV